MHNHHSQSTTVVCGYIRSVNILFQLRGYTIAVDLSDKESICMKIVKARERKEDIARQHSPITNMMFVEILSNSQSNTMQDSFEVVMFDFLIIIGIQGFRVSEYTQTTQNEIDVHKYPLGKQVINSLPAMDAHECPLFIELCGTVVSHQIFIRSQSLIAH